MTKVEYVACMICGRTVLRKWFTGEPLKIKPSEFNLLQIRQQVGGRDKQGFFLIPEECKNILELLNGSQDEKELAQCLIERLVTIVKDYIVEGVIKREDLT